MKNTLYTILIIALLAVAAFLAIGPRESVAPADENLGEEVLVEENNQEGFAPALATYSHEVDTERSTISWSATKKFVAEYTDSGTLKLERGSLNIPTDQYGFTGEFVFDMNSIIVTDTGFGGGHKGLENDLKSENFFETEKYPLAVFLITESSPENSEVSGFLTIKGVTKPLTLTLDEWNMDEAYVTGSATVNRLDFEIDFRSDGIAGVVKDQIIDENFTLNFKIYYTENI